MAVYVDSAMIPYGRMLMSHMIADTPEELHLMAKRIGVQRRWYQNGASFPHYDICASRRLKAVQFGAVEVTRQELSAHMRRLRPTLCPVKWELQRVATKRR